MPRRETKHNAKLFLVVVVVLVASQLSYVCIIYFIDLIRGWRAEKSAWKKVINLAAKLKKYFQPFSLLKLLQI